MSIPREEDGSPFTRERAEELLKYLDGLGVRRIRPSYLNLLFPEGWDKPRRRPKLAKRITPVRTRMFAVTINAELPATLKPEDLRRIVAETVASMSIDPPAVTIKPVKRTITLRNRLARKAGTRECPVGCGRTFATAKGLTIHLDSKTGTFSDRRRFPDGCLSAPVPVTLRDSR